jgi:hypothetical protein
VLVHHDSSAAPRTVQSASPVCGAKNFVSVPLYSAPQLHRTIVAILGICAYGEPDQAGSRALFKGTHYLSLSRLGRHTARRQRLLSGTPTGRRFDVSGMERPFQKRASSFRKEQSSKRPDAHLPGVARVGPSR